MEHGAIDQLLEELSNLILDLTAIRDGMIESAERQTLNARIGSLSNLWRHLDEERAELAGSELSDATSALERIAAEVRAERRRLQDTTGVMRSAERAIAIVERIVDRIVQAR